MRKLLLIVTLIPLLSFLGCKKEKLGDLQGVLYNGNQVLAFTNVFLYSNGKEFAKTLTDNEGNFFMGELPVGNYKLQGLNNGTYTNPVDVSIKENEVTSIDINFKQILCAKGNILEGPPVNPTNLPLVNVKIEIVHSILNEIIQTVYTDQDGYFEVWDIEKGSYTIKIYHTTYAEIAVYYSGESVLTIRKIY